MNKIDFYWLIWLNERKEKKKSDFSYTPNTKKYFKCEIFYIEINKSLKKNGWKIVKDSNIEGDIGSKWMP